MKLFRTLAFMTLVLVLFSLPSFAQSITFTTPYVAPTFNATFQTGGTVGFHLQPGIPNKTFGDLTANVYEADNAEKTLSVLVAYIDYPSTYTLLLNLDSSLSGSRDAIFAAGTVTGETRTNANIGRLFARGAQFVGTTKNDGSPAITVYERTASIGQRQWLAMIVVNPPLVVTQQDADAFFNSIVLTQ